MNFFILIKALLYTYSRKIYSIYRASKIKFGSSPKIQLPLRVEGKGKIIFGKNTFLAKGVHLGATEKSPIRFGDNCWLSKNVQILTGKNASLVTGCNVSIGSETRLFINNQWYFEDLITIGR